jgi:hypothetical protein
LEIGAKNRRRLFPRSQLRAIAAAILARSKRSGPMRAYITVAGLALGLIVVWAALVQFVA